MELTRSTQVSNIQMAIVDDSTKTGADSKSNGGTTLRDPLLHNRKNGPKGGFSYSALEDFSDDESQKQTMYEAHGDLWQDAGSDAHHQYSKVTGRWYTRVWHFLQTVLFLAILGMLSSVAGLIIDGLCWCLFTIRKLATTVPFEPDNVNRTTGLPIYTKVVEPKPHQWFLYIVMNMLLASAAFLLTRFITPQARGSGIPRMKGF